MKNKLLLTLIFAFISSVVFAETAIYCPKCKRHLYDYQKELIKGQEINVENFKSIDDVPSLIKDEEIICPFDRTYLNGWEYWAQLQHFKSFTMAYRAVSFLSKDKDEKWIWLPDDLPMINMNEEK